MRVDERTRSLVLLILAGASLACGCSDDDGDDGEMPSGPGEGEGPAYVMMSHVFDANGDRTVFYPVTDTLDPPSPVTLEGVHQEPGVANLQAAGGKVFISSGLAPRIIRYRVGDDLELSEDATINFTSFGLPEDGANFYNQFVLNDEAIYLMMTGFERIVWNPRTMKIVGHYEDETVPEPPPDMEWSGGGNRADIHYPDSVRQVFSAGGELLSHEVSQLVAYDPETHEEQEVVELPCGGLAIATMDEDGNAYYSPYQDGGVPYLFGLGPKPCVARVSPELGVETIDISEITGGYYGGNFRYLKDGYALAVVLRHDRFEKEYDYESGEFDETIWEEAELASSWELWILNLDTGKGEPVEGISQFYPQTEVIDDRAFVMVPDFELGMTQIYELTDEGKLEKHIEVQGDLFKWVRVR